MSDLPSVLLIEDDEPDAELIQMALKDLNASRRLFVVSNGREARQFFKAEPPFQDRKLPDLIILDLNLPDIDGRQLLKEIRSEPTTRNIPVVVFTGSKVDSDLLDIYNEFANCAIPKPVGAAEYIRAVRTIENFWLHIAKLPRATE